LTIAHERIKNVGYQQKPEMRPALGQTHGDEGGIFLSRKYIKPNHNGSHNEKKCICLPKDHRGG